MTRKQEETGNQKEPRFAGRPDIIIIVAILLLAVGAFYWMRRPQPYEGKVAKVYAENEEIGVYPLEGIDSAGDLAVPGHEHVVLRFDGQGTVRFHESDCLDRLCVLYGPLSLVNESFACLPNEVVVRIDVVGGTEMTDEAEPPDIIVG